MVWLRLREAAKFILGLGLLLLLAVQEKLCPQWLAEPKSAVKAQESHAKPVPNSKNKKPTPSVPIRLLLDAVPPRGPSQFGGADARQGGFRQSEYCVNGQARVGTDGNSPLRAAESGLAHLQALLGWTTVAVETPAADFAPRDPAVKTRILKTGPPVA